jgi:hypothetical protein
MKLSPTQRSVLEKLAEGVKLSLSSGFDRNAWIASDKPHFYKSVRVASVYCLLDKGLIEKIGQRSGIIDYYTISAAGRRLLEKL